MEKLSVHLVNKPKNHLTLQYAVRMVVTVLQGVITVKEL